ncbi:MAG: beta-ribofuranosylaminobenzene 5'-phosphate synthase family protein [Methylophilaceae bacterium]
MLLSKNQSTPHVFVNAFARLHMGFLDLNGSLGKRFGSLGLGLNAPDTLIELAIGKNVFGHDAEPGYISNHKQLILAHVQEAHNISNADGSAPEVSIKLHREIPRHFGLGSGTQMALAIGAGINHLFGLNITPAEIAVITGRGQRSGVGIGTFSNGGLVLDEGRDAHTKIPQLVAQHPFPAAWRILLVFDHRHVGVHGEAEKKAFASLEDADLDETQKINHRILMHAIPAIKQHDLHAFGNAIKELQAYTGDYFSPVQGGRYASSSVTKVLNYLAQNGVSCVGQSSWGPTGFAVFESEEVTAAYLAQLKTKFKEEQLSWLVSIARNEGASVKVGNIP